MRVKLWWKPLQHMTPQKRLSCGGNHHPLPPREWQGAASGGGSWGLDARVAALSRLLTDLPRLAVAVNAVQVALCPTSQTPTNARIEKETSPL